MRANEFLKEAKLGVEAKRAMREGSRPPRGHKVQPPYTMDEEFELDEAGGKLMGTKKRCLMPNAKKRLPASEVSKCKAKGLVTRDGDRKFKIDGKIQSVKGKKVKSDQYGGPIPTWKGN